MIPTVRIHWRDSASIDAWTPLEQAMARRVAVCVSVGALLHSDSDRVVVAGSWHELDGEATYGSIMIIPAECVVRTETLEATT